MTHDLELAFLHAQMAFHKQEVSSVDFTIKTKDDTTTTTLTVVEPARTGSSLTSSALSR